VHLHTIGQGPDVWAFSALPLTDTICERMLAGRIGHHVPDVSAEPARADLSWPAQIGVNACLGVPITTADRRMYLLCCLARERRPDFGAADVTLLPVAQRNASSGVAGSWVRPPRSRRATPLATAALATASATDSATRRLKTLGMM